MINIIKLVCTIIGTFIGAGFASGKEIYSFFYKYGAYGIIGIFISSFFIGYTIYCTLRICKKNNIFKYDDFLESIIQKKYIKNIFLNLINIFFVLSFCIMSAGFSAFLEQEFNLNKIINYIFLLFFIYFILKKKSKGIIKINKIVTPMIIFLMIFLFVRKIKFINFVEFSYTNISEKNNGFFVKSILYASYNLLTMIPIVVSMNNLCKKNKNIKITSIICSLIILVLSIIVFIILGQTNINLESIEMPTVFIVNKYGIIYRNIFTFVIIASIVTTLISCGYSFLQKYENDNKKYNKRIYILIICAILSSKFGFSQMIEILYPVFGVIALVQEILLLRLKK